MDFFNMETLLLTLIAGLCTFISFSESQVNNEDSVTTVCRDSTCYEWNQRGKSWSDAQQACEARQSRLAVIQSVEDQAAISDPRDLSWLGLTISEDKTLEWQSDWPVADSYLRQFQLYEAASKTMSCVILKIVQGSVNLSLAPCTSKLSYVCEKSYSGSNKCTFPYRDEPKFGRCIHIVKEPDQTNWLMAASNCTSGGGVLLTVRNATEWRVLTSEKGIVSSTWLGASAIIPRWSSGATLPGTTSPRITLPPPLSLNWNFTSMETIQERTQCMVLDGASGLIRQAVICLSPFPFICSFPQGSRTTVMDITRPTTTTTTTTTTPTPVATEGTVRPPNLREEEMDSTWVYIVIGIGVLILVVTVVLVFLYCHRRNRRRRISKEYLKNLETNGTLSRYHNEDYVFHPDLKDPEVNDNEQIDDFHTSTPNEADIVPDSYYNTGTYTENDFDQESSILEYRAGLARRGSRDTDLSVPIGSAMPEKDEEDLDLETEDSELGYMDDPTRDYVTDVGTLRRVAAHASKENLTTS